jgi:tungstate transport system ATP-binding protein
MEMIKLENVSKYYDKILALNNISISVNQGEILALVGPTGSGKTTMLKIMAGLERVTNGRVYFKGKEVSERELRRLATMVFQKTVHFDSSVYNNIAYGLKVRNYSKKKIDEVVKHVIKEVGLEGFEDRNARRLSGGEQQKVAIARALAVNAELLLLDEPASNLDVQSVNIIEGLIQRLRAKRNLTIVMATHNLLQAERLADRILLLVNGRIMNIERADVFFSYVPRLKSLALMENVFKGKANVLQEGMSVIKLENDVEVLVAKEVNGEATIYIEPESIIISKRYPESSARNVLKAKVIGLLDAGGGLVKVKADAGIVLTSSITKRALEDMKLKIGDEVYLLFKASSVIVS